MRKIKILIVDDDKEIRGLFCDILTRRNFVVKEAGNGKEGVESAIQEKPDLIILDVMMPVMNGFEAARCLKSNRETQNIPIIFCTATHADEVKHNGDDYLEKPVKLEELFKKIDRIVKVS